MATESDHFAPAYNPMHAKSATERNAYLSMLKKDHEAHRSVTDSYLSYWENGGNEKPNTDEEGDARKENYMSLVNR